MSRKTLNQANLERLGPQRLAALVLELVQGSAALQRRARLELSAAQGPGDVAADVRKRFASVRRARGFVDARRQKALVKDLRSLLAMIEAAIAPHDPDTAFALLWELLWLAPAIHRRTDDGTGAVGAVMGDAVDAIARLAPHITIPAPALAEQILEAVAQAGSGAFDGIVPALSEALGDAGLAHLGRITAAWRAAPPDAQDGAHQAGSGAGLRATPAERARRDRDLTASLLLADIADARGDVDAYMARYSDAQLTHGTIAPGVARRLLDAGRVEEAHAIVTRARAAEEGKPVRLLRDDLDAVHEACLERLGRTEALKAHLWDSFTQGLSARALRKYLGLLPDFDDIEAEEAALTLAARHPHAGAALGFLVAWPAHGRAARLVLARAPEMDGNDWHTLSSAADALEARHPLAATVLRRAMVRDTLEGARAQRYRHAARHLAECAACDGAIADYAPFPTHAQFVAALRQRHPRTSGFWRIVDG